MCYKVLMIFRQKSIVSGICRVGVFELASKVTHSCAENCWRHIQGGELECRSITHIKAGELLTFSYLEDRALEPIHKRRHAYLTMKGFTCHCARCDALGDDTRQFECFNPKCAGRHLVCQPISPDPLPLPCLFYEGVEYVEPHLLPCTVCQRPAPRDYAAHALSLEQHLHNEIERVYEEAQRSSPQKVVQLLQYLLGLPVPRWHGLAHQFTVVRRQLMVMLHADPRSYMEQAMFDHRGKAAELQALRVAEAILPGASQELWERCLWVAGVACADGDVAHPKEVLQRAIRMHLIRMRRESRNTTFDDGLVMALLQYLPRRVRGLEVCAFCEESPTQAAMKRSRCGACRQVLYCSKGCQKAHWKVHKMTCATEDGEIFMTPFMPV